MQNEKVYKILSSLSFFEHFKESELQLLSLNSQILNFNKGEILYYEGDVKDKLYYLVSGELKFYKVDRFDNEIFLYYLSKNSMISDTTQVGSCSQRPCFANTEFTKDSQVIAFDSDYFLSIMQSNVDMATNFIQDVAKRIGRLEYVISRDVIYDGTAKVACMIVEDLVRFNALKKHEIAYELHMQPETLSRILAKMVRNSLITIDKNKVAILDIKGLRAIYEIGEGNEV